MSESSQIELEVEVIVFPLDSFLVNLISFGPNFQTFALIMEAFVHCIHLLNSKIVVLHFF